MAVLLFCGCLAAASPSAAQSTQAPMKPVVPNLAGPKHEIAVGGIFSAPSSMGSADAQLLGSTGQPSVTLFSTKNSMSAGFGPEVLLGFRARRTLWIEAGGTLTWPSLQTKIDHDFEGAPAQTLSAPVTRWTLEGAAVFWLKDHDRTGWFVRVAGGAVGESSSDQSTNAIGFLGSCGVGVRHWFHESKGGLRKTGIRAEFRGIVQSGGLSLSDRTIRFSPTGAVHLVFGY